MADEKVEMTKTEQVTEMVTDQQHSETPTEKVEVSKAEFEKMQAALKEANKEAAARRKRLEELEAAEAKRKEAEMTETEKATKRAQELEAKLKAYELGELQRAAAEKAGLPAQLAKRLQGSTAEELEADAKALAETLPKPTKTTANVTNPGANGQQGETDAQRKARIFGTDFDPFDPETAKRKGGGFFITGE